MAENERNAQMQTARSASALAFMAVLGTGGILGLLYLRLGCAIRQLSCSAGRCRGSRAWLRLAPAGSQRYPTKGKSALHLKLLPASLTLITTSPLIRASCLPFALALALPVSDITSLTGVPAASCAIPNTNNNNNITATTTTVISAKSPSLTDHHHLRGSFSHAQPLRTAHRTLFTDPPQTVIDKGNNYKRVRNQLRQ